MIIITGYDKHLENEFKIVTSFVLQRFDLNELST